MPTLEKFAVWLHDDALVTALKTAADQQGLSIAGLMTRAITTYIAHGRHDDEEPSRVPGASRFAVWLFDEAAVKALCRMARDQNLTVHGVATCALRQYLETADALWVFDGALLEQFRVAAKKTKQPVTELLALVMRQYLDGALHCPRCAGERARHTARRRSIGIPERQMLPKLALSGSTLPTKQCPICDTQFVPTRTNGREQEYCSRGNRRCMKYAGRAKYDFAPAASRADVIELARRRYAAKAHTFTD